MFVFRNSWNFLYHFCDRSLNQGAASSGETDADAAGAATDKGAEGSGGGGDISPIGGGGSRPSSSQPAAGSKPTTPISPSDKEKAAETPVEVKTSPGLCFKWCCSVSCFCFCGCCGFGWINSLRTNFLLWHSGVEWHQKHFDPHSLLHYGTYCSKSFSP